MITVCLNPPIRGSIESMFKYSRWEEANTSQSPYKGFNRGQRCEKPSHCLMRLNPPIRGSIVGIAEHKHPAVKSQSPYKGFNRG